MVTKDKQRALVTLENQALQYQRSGNLKAAKAVCLDLLKLDPSNVDALNLLACIYDDIGNTGQAVKTLALAVKINPKMSALYFNMANMLFKQGSLDEAIAKYREAIGLRPDYAAAHNNLGRLLSTVGKRDEARACFERAISCAKQGYPDPYHNLGIELKSVGEFVAAVAAIQEALRIQPNFPDAYCNLGSAYLQMHRVSEAADAFLTAAKMQPGNARFQTNVGVAMLRMGRQADALAWFENALRLNPADHHTRSNLLLATSYVTDSAEKLCAQSREWDRHHVAPVRPAMRLHANLPDPERRLRIGYVSADFRNHAAAYWIEPLLTASSQTDFEIFCYSNSPIADVVTQRLKASTDTWVECSGMSDEALFNRIRLDAIDILVDLSSHTDGNRLLVFARQAAPLQVSWFGFPVSTGLQTMQYRFSDRILDPLGQTEQFYSEMLLRFDRFYAAYRPDPLAPEVDQGPAAQGHGVTFASLNTLAKITPVMLELWADILRETPDSRLLLQAAGLESEVLAESLRQVFARKGVTADRLLLRGWTSFEEFTRLGGQADIALDTFPFNGGVTTCHALWMGMPIVTLSGASAASRVGNSILTRLGLQDLVANDKDAYRCVAVALARDSDRIAALRASLRRRMIDGGLLDGEDLARQAQVAYREMWRHWCGTVGGRQMSA